MEPTDVISLFREWESRYPVETWSLHGIGLWPLMRVSVGFRLIAASQGRPRGGTNPPAVSAAERARRALADRRSRVWRARPSDVLFLGYPTNRSALGGRWYDRFFDPLADILDEQGLTHLQLEYRQDGTDYRTPRRRPSLLLRPAVQRVGRRRSRHPERGADRPEGLREFRADIQRRFASQPVARAPSLAQLARLLERIEKIADACDGILRRCRPRVILCTYYYNFVAMGLCLAASRRGIPFVDVQHGVTARNPAYDGWTRFPSGGYALLPDAFWCWSEGDRLPTAGWPEAARHHHRSFVGGHPWEAYWGSSQPFVSAERERLEEIRGGSLNVLVTLSWSTGLSDELKAVLRSSPGPYTWWIRLHPTMGDATEAIQVWCEAHCPGRVFVTLPSRLPLPLLLKHADVHLTLTSSVIQEAAAAGLPTVSVDDAAPAMYPEPFRTGWARATAPAEGAVALEDAHRSRGELPAPRAYPSLDFVSKTLLELTASGTGD